MCDPTEKLIEYLKGLEFVSWFRIDKGMTFILLEGSPDERSARKKIIFDNVDKIYERHIELCRDCTTCDPVKCSRVAK